MIEKYNLNVDQDINFSKTLFVELIPAASAEAANQLLEFYPQIITNYDEAEITEEYVGNLLTKVIINEIFLEAALSLAQYRDKCIFKLNVLEFQLLMKKRKEV